MIEVRINHRDQEVRLASELSQDQLRSLARHGAQARINELQAEISAIQAAFPDLASRRGRPRQQASSAQPATARDARTTGRRGWSAAQRKAAGERMKAYWAKRKAGRKK